MEIYCKKHYIDINIFEHLGFQHNWGHNSKHATDCPSMPKKLDAELPPLADIMFTLSVIAANSLSASKPPGEACMEAVIKASKCLVWDGQVWKS